jgi:hypothetical protein
MNQQERNQRRSRKALIDAAVLLAVPVTIILAVGLIAGGLALRAEIRTRELDDKGLLLRANQNNRDALRQFICIAQNNTLTSSQRTPREKEQVVIAYTKILADLHMRACDLPKDGP